MERVVRIEQEVLIGVCWFSVDAEFGSATYFLIMSASRKAMSYPAIWFRR